MSLAAEPNLNANENHSQMQMRIIPDHKFFLPFFIGAKKSHTRVTKIILGLIWLQKKVIQG